MNDEPGGPTILYVAGPMTGLPAFNYPAFEVARLELQAHGYKVLCPTDNKPDGPADWTWYMRRALAQVIRADGIAVLPEAACSKGACLEIHVARSLDMPVRAVSAWLEMPS